MNITYTQNGDYLIPNIVIRKTKPIGHYGRLRKAYLEMHRPISLSWTRRVKCDTKSRNKLPKKAALNIFAHQTNVNTDARILCYDIRELDEQLRPVGMVVTLDAIFNRVIRNWRQGKRTWINEY